MPKGIAAATVQRLCSFCGYSTPCDQISFVMVTDWAATFCCDECLAANPRLIPAEMCGICWHHRARAEMHPLEEPIRSPPAGWRV